MRFNLLNNPKFRHIVTPAIGFGLGGTIWGWEINKFISDELSINPLTSLYGGMALGVLGGIALGFLTKNSIRLFFRSIVGVILSLTIGVVVFNLFSFVGGQYFPVSFLLFLFVPFFVSGFLITVNFLLLWREKIYSFGPWGGVIFGLSSILGNFLGATIGQAIFDSVLIHYIISYTLMSCVLGGFLGFINYRLRVVKDPGEGNSQ